MTRNKRISDLTGREIEPNDVTTVTITYVDAFRRGGTKVLTVAAEEVADLAMKGHPPEEVAWPPGWAG